MNLLPATVADNDADWHADRDIGNIGINNIGRDFWAFF